MLRQLRDSVANSNIIVVKYIPSQRSHNISLHIIGFDLPQFAPRHSATKTLNSQSSSSVQRGHAVYISLNFPKDKRVTDHYVILAQDDVHFSHKLLEPRA